MHPSPRTLRARAALWLAGLVCLLVPIASAAQDGRPGPGDVIRVRVADAQAPVRIAAVTSETQISGGVARTRMEFELRNPNQRLLEGELQFPLLPGQEVTGFELDIDGQLRPAVAVPKDKGRQVFEDVTRTRVDPALLESAGGRNYKLRVYPLPPQGSRRVVLDIAEHLAQAPGAHVFQLPLRFGTKVDRLQAAVHVRGAGPHAVDARHGAERLAALPEGSSDARVVVVRRDWAGNSPLRVAVRRASHADVVTTGEFRDEHYFHADLAQPQVVLARPAPGRIALLWDASGSGARRDHAREAAVLEAWFRAVREVDVDLVLLRDTVTAPTRFEVRAGDWRALKRAIESVAYDGATRLDGWSPSPGTQEVLLFSDGMANWADESMAPPIVVPLHAIGPGAGSDAPRLRRMAEASGGAYIDLSVTPADAAVRSLRTVRTRVVGLRSASATGLVVASAYPQAGRLVVAGKLAEPRAAIDIELEHPGGRRVTRRFDVERARAGTRGVSVAPGQWAALTLARLDTEGDRNSAAIRRLGMHFGLATRETSLIVLDAVSDYVRHDIEPPAALRAEFERLRAARRIEHATREARHRARVVQSFEAKLAWWQRDFPKDAPPPPSPVQKQADVAARGVASPPPAPAIAAPAMAASLAGAPERSRADPGPVAASIQLRKWVPDAAYARRLRAADPQDLYAVYLDERPGYLASSAFFIDAADIFMDRGQVELGLRILSNLAEMDLDNRHLLRILGYRLLQAGAVKQAIPVLRKVQRLAPDEPQSWRDLALALAADGRRQEAVDLLWHVAATPWAQRFPDVELIALAEMNALLARHAAAGGAALDTSAIDPRLLKPMPLDLRVVLTWDADNTDIDLHVVDPNGEEVFFGRPLSYQGGRVSKDFTGGFGPEEFSLRRAKPGVYTVKAKFYGHRQQVVAPATTLMLWLSTGFGTAAQIDRSTVLRLSGAGDMVTVGTFTVGE